MKEKLEKVIQYCIIGVAFFLPMASGLVNSLIGIAIACWLVKKVIEKDFRLKPSRLNLPLGLFFVISCISIINSVEPKTSITGLTKVLKYLGIYFVIAENINDIKLLKKVIWALALGAMAVCLDGLVQYITGKDLLRSNPIMINIGLKRMTAAYRHCNDFGVYLVTVAGTIWAIALYEFKGRLKWFALGIAALVAICIALTFSRGAVLAFYGAWIVMGIIKRDKIILGVLVASLLVIPFVMPGSVKEWKGSTSSFLEFWCNLDRIAFYKSSIQMIKAHPVIGVGINTYMKAYPKYKVKDVDVITGDYCYAHNNYLQMAGEIGLVGLGIFFWILAAFLLELRAIFKSNRNYVRNAALGIGCGVLAFLLNGLTESSFYFSKIVVVFWVMIGLGVSLKFVKE